MSANPGSIDTHSASELERDTDAIRADMNRTLDEIERKLSPGQLLDRSLGYLREHGGDIAHKVGETVRQNPVPVLMTAAGLLWMIAATYRSSSTRDERQDARSGLQPEYGTGLDSDADGAAGGVSEKLKNTAASAGERVRSSGHAISDRARATTTAATSTVKNAIDSTRGQTQRARQGFKHMVDEQPVALGAIGLAVGAILGAALPTTEWENRTLSQARERALSKAKELGEQKYEDLRETVRGAATSPGSSASRNGGAQQEREQYAGRV